MGNLLETLQAEGQLDSSGRFSLALTAAQRQLAGAGQEHPGAWVLKIIAAFTQLDVYQLRVSVARNGCEWSFSGTRPKRALDFSQKTLGLGGSAEDDLRVGLIGLSHWPIDYARLTQGPEWSHPLIDQGQLQCTPPPPGEPLRVELVIHFQRSPDLHHRPTLRRIFSARVLWPTGDLPPALPRARYWFEAGWGTWPIRPLADANLSCKITPDGPGCRVLVRAHLQGPSLFQPVRHGVALDPFELLCPPGLTIVFDASALPTDLSGRRLVYGEELQTRLAWLAEQVADALQGMLEQWHRADQILGRKRRQPTALLDLPPLALGTLGLWLLPNCCDFGEFLLAAALCLGLPLGYYRYSRGNQSSYFEELRRNSRAFMVDQESRWRRARLDGQAPNYR